MSCDIWQAQAVTDVNFALSFLFLSIYYVRLVCSFISFLLLFSATTCLVK